MLLSDGDDVGSATSLDSALQQLEELNIRVYTVGIESPDFVPDDLEKIADETGGEFASAASPDDLTAVYEELGFRLGNEYLVSYRSPREPRREGRRRHRRRRRRGARLVLLPEPEHGDGGAV